MSPLVPLGPPAPPQAWQPRPYTQLLRGPRHRWWRPLASFGIVLAGTVLLLLLTFGVLAVALAGSGDVGASGAAGVEDDVLSSWWGFLLNNLVLAALVPLAMLAVLVGHRWRPRWLASVSGGIRWRWLLLSATVPLTVLVLNTGGTWLLARASGESAFGSGDRGGTAHVLALLAVVLATTPLQAAGEEYLFRGWLSQAVGSLFARAGTGALAAGAVSALLFGLAHGSQNPWLFLDRVAFGVLASYLAWRTGGLEAGIAVHALNNVVVFVPTILAGGLDDALSSTEAPVGLVLVDAVVFTAVGVGVSLLARRRRVQRLFLPPGATAPPSSFPTVLG